MKRVEKRQCCCPMGNALEKLISDPVNRVCTILSDKCVNKTGIFKNFSGGAHENAQQFDTVRLHNKLRHLIIVLVLRVLKFVGLITKRGVAFTFDTLRSKLSLRPLS